MNSVSSSRYQGIDSEYERGRNLRNKIDEYTKYIYAVFMVFAIILIVTLSVSTIMSMASSDHCDGDASMVNIVYHQNCKTKGGCGKTCPFIKPDDPRLVISEELMNVRNVYENVKQSIKDDTELVSDTLAKIEVEDSEKVFLKLL